MENKFTFFFSGPFNQAYSSSFIAGNRIYTSTEQYMMAQKALLFNDKIIFEQIMSIDDPATQKALGRKIEGFVQADWEAICKKVVYDANYAKFTQNIRLYFDLIETKNTELVYAAANDSIWGVGLTENDSRILDKTEWQGTNWLGEILTKVREDLILERTQRLK